jgi:uncharacterized protein with PQ loop repeat
MWQDIGISIIAILFNIALVPQIIYGVKTKRKTIATSTATLTSLGAYFIAYIYFTLELYVSTAIQSIGATLWFVLLIQSIKYRKKH